jgi:hypothetical protein
VILENPEHRFSVTSQADGGFQFVGVPAGSYRLAARLKPFTPSPAFHNVFVKEGRCTQISIPLKTDCSIEGVLLTWEGKPFAGERVELLRRNRTGKWYETASMWTNTNKQGVFRFTDLPSGEYLLGHEIWGDRPAEDNPFPTHYYPGVAERAKAEVIPLSPGMRVKNRRLQVPPAHTGRRISVRVVTAEGNPGGRNFLQIFSKGRRFPRNLRGDETEKAVEFSGFQEREYEFTADYWFDDLDGRGPAFAKRILKAESVKLSPGKDDAELVLVLPAEPTTLGPATTVTRSLPIVLACLIAAGVLTSAFFLFRRLTDKKKSCDSKFS